MRCLQRGNLIFSVLIFLIVFLDQISKFLVKFFLFPYESITILGDFLRFTYIENSGIAFGIDTSDYHLFVTLLTVITILFLFYYSSTLKKENHYEKIPLSLIIGGAIGNCIDRIFVLFPTTGYNGVVDFIDMPNVLYYIGLMDNPRWFIFNIADSSITIGLVIYFFYQYKIENSHNESSRNI